jgi:hypothetical protein
VTRLGLFGLGLFRLWLVPDGFSDEHYNCWSCGLALKKGKLSEAENIKVE